MKRLIFAVLMVVVMALPVIAQTTTKPVIYVGGGVGLTLSPTEFKNYWKMGFGGGGGVGLQINGKFEVIGKVFLYSFPLNKNKLLTDQGNPTGVTISGGAFQVIEFGLDGKYLFPVAAGSKFGPFLVVGVGMGNAKFKEATVSGGTASIPIPSASETKVAFNVGAGFDYMFSPKAGLWVEGRYASISTTGSATGYLPIRAGLKFVLGK